MSKQVSYSLFKCKTFSKHNYYFTESVYSLAAGLVFGGILGVGAYLTSVNPRNYHLTLGNMIQIIIFKLFTFDNLVVFFTHSTIPHQHSEDYPNLHILWKCIFCPYLTLIVQNVTILFQS